MEAKTELTCPLGHKCQEPIDGVMRQCAWFTKLQGKDAQGKEHDEYGCAMGWMPILLLETSGGMRQVAASIQSARNENVTKQEQMIELVEQGKLGGLDA